jgi:4-hydroxybenzoate polyprenyltransferase
MKRILLILALLITALFALEPFGIVMPSETQMISAGVLLGLLVFTIGILWQEKPTDEREEEIINSRGKNAFYIGLSVGAIGIIVGAFTHKIDWWLVAVVGSMLMIKLARKM